MLTVGEFVQSDVIQCGPGLSRWVETYGWGFSRGLSVGFLCCSIMSLDTQLLWSDYLKLLP
jgi:hypothetical protein